MKNKLSALLLALCLAFAALLALPAGADFQQVERTLPLVVDDCGVLTDEDYYALNARADQLSELYQCEVAVIFLDSTDGENIRDVADDIFDYYGYGWGPNDDGILLLVAVYDRNYWITTHSRAIGLFTDSIIDAIGDRIVDQLRDDDWNGGAVVFLNSAEEVLSGQWGKLTSSDWAIMAIIAMFAGLLLSFIPLGVLKGQLKSVAKGWEASDYVPQGAAALTDRRDIFLRNHVTRTKIESSSSGGSSTHTSSSGRSHGGGGGRF